MIGPGESPPGGGAEEVGVVGALEQIQRREQTYPLDPCVEEFDQRGGGGEPGLALRGAPVSCSAKSRQRLHVTRNERVAGRQHQASPRALHRRPARRSSCGGSLGEEKEGLFACGVASRCRPAEQLDARPGSRPLALYFALYEEGRACLVNLTPGLGCRRHGPPENERR